MALPSSGALTLAAIGYEAQKPLLSAVNINDVELRKLVNLTVPMSMISFRDFYGKAYGVGPAYYGTSFIDALNQLPNTLISSNTVLIQGLSASGTSSTLTNATQVTVNSTVYPAGSLFTLRDGDLVTLKATTPALGTQFVVSIQCANGQTRNWNVGSFSLVPSYTEVTRTTGTNNYRYIGLSKYTGTPGGTILDWTVNGSTWSIGTIPLGTSYIRTYLYPEQYTEIDDQANFQGSHSTSYTPADAGWWKSINLSGGRVQGVAKTTLAISTAGQVQLY